MNSMPAEPLDQSPPIDLPPVEAPSAGFIVQLFVIPAVIVVVVIVVWLLFGKLAGGERDAMSYVETIKSPSANWRAAFELTSLIQNDPKLSRDPKLLGELAALLDHDLNLKTDETLLQYLTLTLGMFQTLEAQSGVGDKVDVIAVLCRALEDTRPASVQIAAGMSLAKQAARLEGTLEDPRPIKALAATRSSDSPEVRKVAAYALGFFGGPEATAALKAVMEDGDRDVRYNAALALGRRDEIVALGNFRELLSDKSLELLYKETPEDERKSKVENLELEALNSLSAAAAKGHYALLTALRPEVEALTRSGLVTVRSRAQEVLKSLPESR